MIRRHHHYMYHHHHHKPCSYIWNLNTVSSFSNDVTWWRINICFDGYYYFNGFFRVLRFWLFLKSAERAPCIKRAWQLTLIPVYWRWLGRPVDCVVFTMLHPHLHVYVIFWFLFVHRDILKPSVCRFVAEHICGKCVFSYLDTSLPYRKLLNNAIPFIKKP